MSTANLRRKWLSDIYEAYADDVCNVIRFRLRPAGLTSSIDDVLQEVFVTAYEKYENLTNHPDIRRWLFATANFKCKNLIRKRTVEGHRILWVSNSTCCNESPDPTAEQAFAEVLDGQVDYMEIMQRIKAEMSNGDVLLYTQVYEDMIHPTLLSKHYGISEAAMRMRITRLRRKVIEIIKNILCVALIFSLADIFQ